MFIICSIRFLAYFGNRLRTMADNDCTTDVLNRCADQWDRAAQFAALMRQGGLADDLRDQANEARAESFKMRRWLSVT